MSLFEKKIDEKRYNQGLKLFLSISVWFCKEVVNLSLRNLFSGSHQYVLCNLSVRCEVGNTCNSRETRNPGAFSAIFCIIFLFLNEYSWNDCNLFHFKESVLLRDRLCNFLLYKAVFLFGVLNSVVHEEVIAWIMWFALLASVAALQSIIAYKLKYVSI